jgi:uncharacterized protein YdeI (YjbR/CyaY-like superfamily)
MDDAETINGVRVLYARSVDEWRAWLAANCWSQPAVWLAIYHKQSKTPSVSFHDAIEHALCYGWVDSKAVKRDAESFYLLMSPRNPRSTWGIKNRERAAKMIRFGYMTPHGQALIDHAKKTGAWDTLAEAQNLVIPDDLQTRFAANLAALENFLAFPPSSKRLILEWIAKAKRQETREKRITQTVELAADNVRANHPRR